jgi:hypothetical protein
MLWAAAAPTKHAGASYRKTKLKENGIRLQFNPGSCSPLVEFVTHSGWKAALFCIQRQTLVAPPSRRLSGGRLARLRARDALATAGKIPALLSFAQRFRIDVIEKTRRIPAAGFRSGVASLYRLGQAQFAPNHSSQTDQTRTQQAQGARLGNREVGVATG